MVLWSMFRKPRGFCPWTSEVDELVAVVAMPGDGEVRGRYHVVVNTMDAGRAAEVFRFAVRRCPIEAVLVEHPESWPMSPQKVAVWLHGLRKYSRDMPVYLRLGESRKADKIRSYLRRMGYDVHL